MRRETVLALTLGVLLALTACTPTNTTPSHAPALGATGAATPQAVAASASPPAVAATADPIDGGCPVDQPVKGDATLRAFATDHPDYGTIVATACFSTLAVATAQGYNAQSSTTAAAIGNGCPADFPVKVDAGHHSYDTAHPDYATVVPTSCYSTAAAAVQAGDAAAALPPAPTRAATQPPAPTKPPTTVTQTLPAAPTKSAVPVQPPPAAPANANGATPQCPHGFIPSPGNGRGPTLCKDGLCSHSAGSGTCSGHGGEALLIEPHALTAG
jgi:hypothetical protein